MFLGFFYFTLKIDLNNKLHTKKFFSMLYLRSPLKKENNEFAGKSDDRDERGYEK